MQWQGAFIKGHPVYMGSLPDVSFMVEGELGEHADGFAELEVVIETFDGQTKLRQDLAEALKSILEDDSWLDLNVLAELLDISAEQDMKMSFVWRDANGMRRSISVFRISGLIIDFDKKAFVLQKDEIAMAEMIVPPGWKFVAGSGRKDSWRVRRCSRAPPRHELVCDDIRVVSPRWPEAADCYRTSYDRVAILGR